MWQKWNTLISNHQRVLWCTCNKTFRRFKTMYINRRFWLHDFYLKKLLSASPLQASEGHPTASWRSKLISSSVPDLICGLNRFSPLYGWKRRLDDFSVWEGVTTGVCEEKLLEVKQMANLHFAISPTFWKGNNETSTIILFKSWKWRFQLFDKNLVLTLLST